MRSLLLAVRDRLRAAPLSYPAAQCDITVDGAPHPAAGEVWVGVHPGPVRSESDLCLDETYEVKVTLTLRACAQPLDRWGPQILTLATTGLYARAEAIRAVLHMDYESMNRANAGQSYSIGTGDNGFVEPLKYQGMGTVLTKGPEWFSAEDESIPAAGLALELTFGGCRRAQTIEEQS